MRLFPAPGDYHNNNSKLSTMDNSLIPLATEGAAPNPPEAVKQCKKRTKWSKPTDPSLEQRYGSKEIALDVSIQIHSDVLGPELRKGCYIGRGILEKGPSSVMFGGSSTLGETSPRYVELLPIDKSVCLCYIYRR